MTKSILLASSFLLAFLFAPSFALYNTTSCQATNYFDTTLLNCAVCQNNASPDSSTSCKCNPGYYYSQTNLVGWKGTCSICPADRPASSTDRKTCMACPSGNSASNGECVCASGIPYDVDINGQPIIVSGVPTKACLVCPAGTFADPNGKGCISCGLGMTTDSNNNCVCTVQYVVAGDGCVAATDLSNPAIGSSNQVSAAKTIVYNDVEDTTGKVSSLTSVSGTIEYLYSQAVVGCILYRNPQNCQTFANLCVLTAYRGNSVPCRLYQTTMSNIGTVVGPDAGDIESLPWIYYLNNPVTTVNNSGLNIPATLNNAKFILAKYSIDGTYLGTETLTNQLLACSNSAQAGNYLKNPQVLFINNCDLDLTLIQDAETIFYDMFLVDNDGTKTDIPVKIKNLVTSSAATPNTGDLSSSTVLTRRFFISDTLSGVTTTNGFKNRATPSVIRFAKNIRLVFSTQEGDSSKMNRPYLEIEYASKETQYLTTNSTSYVTFRSGFQNAQYVENPEGSAKSERILALSKFWGILIILTLAMLYEI